MQKIREVRIIIQPDVHFHTGSDEIQFDVFTDGSGVGYRTSIHSDALNTRSYFDIVFEKAKRILSEKLFSEQEMTERQNTVTMAESMRGRKL